MGAVWLAYLQRPPARVGFQEEPRLGRGVGAEEGFVAALARGVADEHATRPTSSRSKSSLVRRSRAAWAASATRQRFPGVGRDGAAARPPRCAPVYRRTSSGKANPRPRPIGRGTHSASTTQTCPKLKNGLRAVESNGSWCIAARLTHLPLLRARVSSPSKYSGCSAGSHRSACSNTLCPSASKLHCARAKNRWNTEIWRTPTAPD